MEVPPAGETTRVIKYLLRGGFDGVDKIVANPLKDKIIAAGADRRRIKAAEMATQYGQVMGVTVLPPPNVDEPREGQEFTDAGRVTFQKGYSARIEYSVRYTSGVWLLSGLELTGIGRLNVPESSIAPPPS